MADDRRRRAALGLGLIVTWLGFVATVLLRPNRGQYNVWFDTGLYNLPFVLAAIACWLRVCEDERDRRGWRALGIGFALYLAGNIYSSAVIGDRDIYPSLADWLWLSFYVLVYVALVQFVKARIAQFLPSMWLDGAIGGLGAAALAVAFALAPVLTQTQGTFAVVATNLAYPTVDVVLLICLVMSANALRVRDPSWWLLAVGMGVLCAGDIGFLFVEAAGTYAEGGLLDISWPAGAALVGLGACAPAANGPALEAKQRFVIPTAFTAIAVGLLTVGQRQTLPLAAVVLAVAALAAAATRVALTVREVTSLAESRREARTDDLTGLANRRHLLEHLNSRLSLPDATTSLLLVDVDRFKEVNDSLGHGAGDQLLQAISHRLAPIVGPPSVLARIGGDEFAAVLPEHGLAEAREVAERLRQALSPPFSVAGMLLPVDASIGVAVHPRHAATAESLMSCADIAMYRAKRHRTGVEHFHDGDDRASLQRMTLLGDLRTAIDTDQLTLHYQPQLSLLTGRVCGIEALLRWPHPAGMIPPNDFLPLAEQSNLMSEITGFVIAQALTDCAHLRDAGYPLRVSVNVSASDLIDSNLPDLINAHLARHHLDPQMLVVEVTEDTVMADRVRALQILRRLRDQDVQISVDDYGTGHSSLSYLRDLPITEIKLDRSFLTGVPDDTHNAAIVRSTIELAHALNLPIVTEGVEDHAALDWLHANGCDIGQGFHISRPLPLAGLQEWLAATGTGASQAHATGTGASQAPAPAASRSEG